MGFGKWLIRFIRYGLCFARSYPFAIGSWEVWPYEPGVDREEGYNDIIQRTVKGCQTEAE